MGWSALDMVVYVQVGQRREVSTHFCSHRNSMSCESSQIAASIFVLGRLPANPQYPPRGKDIIDRFFWMTRNLSVDSGTL